MDGGTKKDRDRNPREEANIFSALTFSYTIPTFIKGYKDELEEKDLTQTLAEHNSSKLADKIEKSWKNEERLAKIARRQPSLLRVLWRVFGWEFMFYGLVLAVGEFGIRLLQPIALGQLIAYYIPNQNTISEKEAYLYAGAVVLCSLLNVFVTHPYMMGALHLGMKLRVACCSLVYRKALKLSKTALGQTTVGQVVNLLSNDVNRFDVALIFAHQLWVGPLETIIVAYLMYLQIGVSAFIGVAFLLMFIPLQIFLGRKTSSLRLRTAIRTDERVRLMNEIISGIQVIKMYTWEKPFAKLVSMARRYEIKVVRGTSYVRGILLSFIMFSTRIAVFASIFAFVALGNKITAEQVFVVTAFYNVLRATMTVFFPQGIGMVAEAHVSIGRLNKFLLYEENSIRELQIREKEEREQERRKGSVNSNSYNVAENGNNNPSNGNIQNGRLVYENGAPLAEQEKGIFITNATASWLPDLSEPTLSSISLNALPGHLVAIIGPVGSGKTSLLHTVLRELPLTEGSIRVQGMVSYAAQEPWLFAGSVRQNILFGREMDKQRYRQVVKRCALERDFQLLPHGDKTVVGERGVSLSGGQRARINLARAVYMDADIYLLDDPLSAVDTHVGKQLFEECVTGFLKHKTCILITHQLQYLKKVDHIIILNNGTIQAQGNYQELQASGVDFAKMLEEQSTAVGPGSVTGSMAADSVEDISLSRQNSLSRHNSVSVHSVASEQMLSGGNEEQKQTGTVSGYVYRQYLAAGGNCFTVSLLLFQFILAQIAASAGDYFLTFWTNLEQSRSDDNKSPILQTNMGDSMLRAAFPTSSLDTASLSSLINNNGVNNGVDSSPIGYEDVGARIAGLQGINGSVLLGSLKIDEGSFWDWDRDTCIWVYCAITVATIVITLVRSFSFFSVCMRASISLHDRMFRSITHATMRFFNTNPSGRILNRFSKDMGAIDELLPGAMIDVLQIGLTLIGIIVVVAIVNPWLMIPTVIMAGIFYYLRLIYLATGRSVKRLEGVTRSPVFSHINASIQGLTTIRAFKAEGILQREFDNHQDLHSSAWFMFLATSRAFGYWLDMVCIIYIAIVTLSFLVLGNENFGGNVGLAITQSIGLTGMFQWGMRQSTELENQMTSVERVLEYSDLSPEGDLTTGDKGDKVGPTKSTTAQSIKSVDTTSTTTMTTSQMGVHWPEKGELVFNGVYLRYAPTEAPVLRNLNFRIRSMEKIGIVGRTGAGKSSLITALFRLAETEGNIMLDKVDTKSIGLHDLRSKLSIIPQEPVLFSGTMRSNLDPFDEYDDATLWRALADVELKDAVSELAAGLQSVMSEGGSNFSVGQRQLVCLARAIIRNNKVLILDEATANVDPQTDALIQHTIRSKFAKCTVLTIAHRLHTVMDSDRVLVMDAGAVVELDHPHLLLQNQRGFLYGMVQQTGKQMAEGLAKIAEQNYAQRTRSGSLTKDQ